MTDVARVNDIAVQDWEQFRKRLEAVDYRVMVDMPLLQVMRYAYDAGWADAQSHHDPPPEWESAWLEG